MKACPSCGRLYPDDAGFCPVEGARLGKASVVPPPSSDDRRVGRMLCGRYQVRRVVANGGTGRVYEALDTHESRSVALKILHAEVARDAIQVERFKREFEVSGLLAGERHIAQVYDFQPTPDGSYVLVLEFLFGEELSSTLEREGVLAPARAVRMVSQVALTLDRAHSQRLVHRDLKPANLFLCQTNEGDVVKLLDFGSVKNRGEGARPITVMGTTIGSPYYMAPEQIQGLDTLDHRADVWALAAIGYECVTGHVPFAGANAPSILMGILTREPLPPSVAGADRKYSVPPTLDAVLKGALRKAAVDRTDSVGRLADAWGQAYGLTGTHRDWAYRPEAQLARDIAERLPELLRAQPSVELPSDVVDPMAQAMAAARSAEPDRGPQGRAGRAERWRLPVFGLGILTAGLVAAWFLLG